ncbi:glycosyltransferase [Sphingomonas adhaesiva]|uniref:glycosyltransferase n=1 Tax=Sphingomonas adhaesiva TaxID=28212 RepID=UPI000B064F66|nr:glycosyltransferase [Sphingomonas adhaesiva]
MILVTVGTQLPFDRFIRIVDEAAPSLGRPVFAQVGQGTYQPRNMEYAALIDPLKFDDLIAKTELIVSHAGIGTVVMAQKFRKPVILFPRRAAPRWANIATITRWPRSPRWKAGRACTWRAWRKNWWR